MYGQTLPKTFYLQENSCRLLGFKGGSNGIDNWVTLLDTRILGRHVKLLCRNCEKKIKD